ncbi:MAG: metallophosphoesterase [Planctomycetes bacterium]|nr:metallophosphoesterase [Planctomycetota bacterium]
MTTRPVTLATRACLVENAAANPASPAPRSGSAALLRGCASRVSSCAKYIPAFVQALFAAAALALASFLSVAWIEGSRAWPESGDERPARIATPAADVAALLAAHPEGAPLRIAIVGDVQNGTPELRPLLDEVVRRRPEVVVLLGDAVNWSTPGRYAALREVVRDHGGAVPLLVVPGNHDIAPGTGLATFREWVGPTEWRIDAAGWSILGLDDATGDFSEASLDLVRAARRPFGPRGWIAFAHRPIATHVRNDREPARAAQLHAASPDAAPALFASGHVHEDEDLSDARGTRHVSFAANCDRPAHGPASATVDALLLSLGDGPPTIERFSVPRDCSAWAEVRRVAVADVFPVLRATPGATAVVIAALFVAAFLALRRAARVRARRVAVAA